jgi:two-component system, cell cycle sensor histidine kinase and response regulator CckA
VTALQVAADHPDRIDLLVTDMMLPHLNGRALHERLLKARPGLRVLCISGYQSDEIVRRGYLALGAKVIEKPFAACDLVEAVKEVLSR